MRHFAVQFTKSQKKIIPHIHVSHAFSILQNQNLHNQNIFNSLEKNHKKSVQKMTWTKTYRTLGIS